MQPVRLSSHSFPTLESLSDGRLTGTSSYGREIKFGALFNRIFPAIPGQSSASSATQGLLATGHYAQTGLPASWQPGQPAELLRCPDPVKDQSYFLSAVDGRALSRVRLRPRFKERIHQRIC